MLHLCYTLKVCKCGCSTQSSAVKIILWAHLSCGMTDCDWLNCPEKKAIHFVNDMPPGETRLLFIQSRNEAEADWEALHCACLQPLFFCLRLPLVHINILLWHSHMISDCRECVFIHPCHMRLRTEFICIWKTHWLLILVPFSCQKSEILRMVV